MNLVELTVNGEPYSFNCDHVIGIQKSRSETQPGALIVTSDDRSTPIQVDEDYDTAILEMAGCEVTSESVNVLKTLLDIRAGGFTDTFILKMDQLITAIEGLESELVGIDYELQVRNAIALCSYNNEKKRSGQSAPTCILP